MGPKDVPKPSYSQARETLVKAIPSKIICLLACGGRDCRYEGPACWRPSQQAIKGIFSSWVTDDIVAMARPATRLITRYNIIDQFKKLNIKSIINMQLPGEHAHCGPELDPESGFTYSPQLFMENQIYFYNFGMPDFGVSSMEVMLDAVKVLDFSVREGKVAVHCHAGLGRTGVLIACYLVYTVRISASEAVHYVRIRRPRSIQTRAQINLVFDFARLLGSQLAQYPCLSQRNGSAFSLKQYLQRQTLLLHGEEARSLEQTPKILHFLCSLLKAIALGASSPPEIQTVLKRKTAVLVLQRAVRDTLVLQRQLQVPVPKTAEDSCRSVSSWDDPFGFLERKQEVLLNKRSYSESDLSKITFSKEFINCCRVRENSGKCTNGVALTDQESKNRTADVLVHESDRSPRSDPTLCKSTAGKNMNCITKKSQEVPKFCSNIELRKTYKKPSSSSKAVAKAMAQCEPAEEKILQKAAVLQEELNVSAYGWATLTMESDPKVLSALMWTWLEKLRDPVLSADDLRKLTIAPGINPFKVLQKAQCSTLFCLLGCVAHVTIHYPKLVGPILQRLLQALTKHPTEEILSSNSIVKMFEAKVRDMQHSARFHSARGISRNPTNNKPLN